MIAFICGTLNPKPKSFYWNSDCMGDFSNLHLVIFYDKKFTPLGMNDCFMIRIWQLPVSTFEEWSSNLLRL